MIRRILVAALALAIPALGPAGVSGQQAPLKIGVVYSFSGAGGVAGTEFTNTLAVFQKLHGTTAGGRTVQVITRGRRRHCAR